MVVGEDRGAVDVAGPDPEVDHLAEDAVRSVRRAFHTHAGQNPTLGLQRDLEPAQLLERLGYDEVWFGEHHSGGAELIGSPEVFCGWVAAQTSRIKVGTGVVSLPYHHPLWVADRAILFDHPPGAGSCWASGPGILATDAHMVGIDPAELRNHLQEDFPVLMHLLRSDEPISIDTGRYRLVDARCQLDPCSDFDVAVASLFTPSGPLLAGRYGTGLLQLSGLTPEGMAVLPKHWAQEWASPAATNRSYDPFARHVMPAFQGTTNRLRSSREVVGSTSAELTARQTQGALQFVEAQRHPN